MRKDTDAINRRDFFRSGAIVIVAAASLGLHPAVLNAAPSATPVAADATAIMTAAAAGIAELNVFFRRAADDIGETKRTIGSSQIALAIGRIESEKAAAMVSFVMSLVGAANAGAMGASAGSGLSAGAGSASTSATFKSAGPLRAELTSGMSALSQWEVEITNKGKMTPELRAAIAKTRQTVANVMDVVVARDILIHLSQDKAHATRLLDAVRARNSFAIAEMLKRDVPGSTVVVQDVKEENGVFLTARISNFTYCLSTAGQCSGKQLAFWR